MKKRTKAEISEAIEHLKATLEHGQKVYTVLNHVSGSGMSRSISVFIVENGEIVPITYWVARALDDKIDAKHGGIKVSGCGMDMGYHLIDNLISVLGMESETYADRPLRHVWL